MSKEDIRKEFIEDLAEALYKDFGLIGEKEDFSNFNPCIECINKLLNKYEMDILESTHQKSFNTDNLYCYKIVIINKNIKETQYTICSAIEDILKQYPDSNIISIKKMFLINKLILGENK